MADAPRPITGRCLCGGVTYSVDAEPVWQGACYCANCQRQTATASSVIVGVPSKTLTVELAARSLDFAGEEVRVAIVGD